MVVIGCLNNTKHSFRVLPPSFGVSQNERIARRSHATEHSNCRPSYDGFMDGDISRQLKTQHHRWWWSLFVDAVTTVASCLIRRRSKFLIHRVGEYGPIERIELDPSKSRTSAKVPTLRDYVVTNGEPESWVQLRLRTEKSCQVVH